VAAAARASAGVMTVMFHARFKQEAIYYQQNGTHTRQQERWQEVGHALAQAREGEEEGEGEELEREEEERGGPWIGRGQEGRMPGRDVGRARKKARYSGYAWRA
jgi:hypothetical protein